MTFQQKLDAAVEKNNSLLCVNLDPDTKKIGTRSLFDFNKKIIDETCDLVSCYKPNSAFYEAVGSQGGEDLKKTIDYIREKNPDLPIILDAKRGDIGNTNYKYAEFAFDYLGIDAITMHPYLGGTSLIPFFERKDKGIFVLIKTSNKGAGELQDLMVNDRPLYQHIAGQVVKNWNYNDNVMVVVGATYPEELAAVRKIVGDITILAPGVGAQGAELEKTVEAGINSQKKGLIIAVGRSVIYADEPRKEVEKLREEINQYRNVSSAL